VNNTPEETKNWTFNYDTAKALNAGKHLRNMWSIPYTPAFEKQFGSYPTQKPLEIVRRIVKMDET
jgi:site-specific DNA-methyltransferase (adenine-specific)